MKIDCIDKGHGRAGVCVMCRGKKMVYPVRLSNDAWTRGCESCAETDGASVMK